MDKALKATLFIISSNEYKINCIDTIAINDKEYLYLKLPFLSSGNIFSDISTIVIGISPIILKINDSF